MDAIPMALVATEPIPMHQPPTDPLPTDIIDLTWDTDDEDNNTSTDTAATAAALAATAAAAAAAAVTAAADMAQFTVEMMDAIDDMQALSWQLQGTGGKRPDLVAAHGDAHDRYESARQASGAGSTSRKRRPNFDGKQSYWACKKAPPVAVEESAEPVQPPAKRRRVRVRIKTLEEQFSRWQGVKGKVYPGKRETPTGAKLDCFLSVLPTGELIMSSQFAMTSATVLDCEGVTIRPHANGNLYVPTHNAGKVFFCKQ